MSVMVNMCVYSVILPSSTKALKSVSVSYRDVSTVHSPLGDIEIKKPEKDMIQFDHTVFKTSFFSFILLIILIVGQLLYNCMSNLIIKTFWIKRSHMLLPQKINGHLTFFFPSLSSAGLVSGTTQAEPCFLFITSCPAVVVQSALSGMCPSRAGVQASTAAWVAAPAELAGLCGRQAPWHPQGEGVFSGATQQGVCFSVAQPQTGGVWDQVQHGEMSFCC